MVVNKVLNNIFSTYSNIAILRVLNERKVGVSGREVARLADINLRSAQVALSNLVDLKIVNLNKGNRENLYTLNRDCFISKNIITKIFESEKRLVEKIFLAIKKSLQNYTESVILFGSVAREEETKTSDFDICIIYKNNRKIIEESVSELRDNLYLEFGITLAPYYITKKDFFKSIEQKKSPINELLKEHKIIAGKSLKELLNG
ncbi:MAG: nucleotidyltransferase domain-containing protein [Ignavibacteriales bacterium]|nr:nucleotidyltransferase domain-containing protein [Ignavibacteriales bacterium]